MSIESVTDRIRSKMAMAAGLTAKVKFDFGDEGRIFVDGTQSPPVISDEDGDADTTFECKLETFEAILMDGRTPVWRS